MRFRRPVAQDLEIDGGLANVVELHACGARSGATSKSACNEKKSRPVCPLTSSRRPQELLEVIELGRLGQVCIEARRPSLGDRFGVGITAERHEAQAAELRIGAEDPRDLVAIHLGKGDIAYHHVRPRRSRSLDAGGAVEGDEDLVSPEGEPVTQHVRGVDIVLDDQDAQRPSAFDAVRHFW